MRWHGILLALWVSCIACLLQVSLGQTTECETNSDCANDKCCNSGQCSVYDIGSRMGGLGAGSVCECFVEEISDDNICGCETDSDCYYDDKCCISGQCSVYDKGSREGGLEAGSTCECSTGILGDDDVCGCETDSDCYNDKCCISGQCSLYEKGSRGGGLEAASACECLTGILGDDNVCECETDSDCYNDKCCLSGQCSVYDIGSRMGGLGAASACECFVGEIGDDNICGCETDSDCWDDKCCISGQCTFYEKGSREGGLEAGSACECLSGILGDDNVCGCETDSDCFGDKCCADGLCSTYDKGSRDFGEAIMDACECSSGVDAGDATCGEGEALTNACFVSGSDDYRCIPGRGKLINLSDCGLTDEDIDDLRACVEEGSSSFGIENVKKINLKRNDFTTLPSDLFSGLLKLRKLNVKANCDLGCVPAPDGASTKELEIRTSRCNKNAIDSVC